MLLLLFVVLVKKIVLVVVPEVRVVYHVNSRYQVVFRIKFLIKSEIHIDLLARLESYRHNIFVVVQFFIAVEIGYLASVKSNYMIFNRLTTFCNSRIYKRLNFLYCHNIRFFVVIVVYFPAAPP